MATKTGKRKYAEQKEKTHRKVSKNEFAFDNLLETFNVLDMKAVF